MYYRASVDDPTANPSSSPVEDLNDRMQIKYGLDDFVSVVSTVVQNER